ncbi:uncharacterized protein LOC110985364 [Acanthaster planci]|uniref:Uncharacterized protein LOC110985364 n=1 Tax=Acanthaster planci TaxID=133434 RepID=A0A8B7ZFM2_ACAPL|nr:uncharacterized protein LOC110985364 [Acanthaster planci]
MGQDVMPLGIAGPGLSSTLPQRERVFLRGLYSDVEARLGRVDSGIEALRRRVRDFDGVLDGQIRRCESAEDRVRSLREDFSRMDRQISEMSAELESTLEVMVDDEHNANGQDLSEDIQGTDPSLNCDIKVSRSSPANLNETNETCVTSKRRNARYSSSESGQIMETSENESQTNVTGADAPASIATANTSSQHDQAVSSHIANSSQLPDEQFSDSEEHQVSSPYEKKQPRNRRQPCDGNEASISIRQDNSAVSIGVVCNLNQPTANGQGQSKPVERNPTELSRAEQRLINLASELVEFRSLISSKRKSEDGLVEHASLTLDSGAAGTEQGEGRNQGVTVLRAAASTVNRLHHPPNLGSQRVSVEEHDNRYEEFDRYVEEIIKRHSSDLCQEFKANAPTDIAKTFDDDEVTQELDQLKTQREERVTLPSSAVCGDGKSETNTTQWPAPKAEEPDPKSVISTAGGYTTSEETDSPCDSSPRQDRVNIASCKTGAARHCSFACDEECCHQVAKYRSGHKCSNHRFSPDEETRDFCCCCLRDVLATYVRHFLQLLHSRVTKETKKRTKTRRRDESDQGRVMDSDIVRARDAVFGRLGLTTPMLEVLLEFDQHHRAKSRRQQIDPAHVSDDEIHRLLVTMGMSWHTMNNHLHDNDCAFRIAIATVHAQMHHMD